MATVTLSYQVAAGVHPLAALLTKVAGVPLLRGELSLLGMSLSSDNTTIDGSEINRTIVLATTDEGDTNFPDATSLAYATKKLYAQELALGVPATVVAEDPVVVA